MISAHLGMGPTAILAPKEVVEILGKMSESKVTKINKIRALWPENKMLPLVPSDDIFIRIAAGVAEEQREKWEDATHYWRTLEAVGEIDAKYPGAVEGQRRVQEKEGHKMVQNGPKYVVVGFEK
jgi:hypothetical protein